MTTIASTNVSLSNMCNQLQVDTVAPFSYSNLYASTGVTGYFGGATLPAFGNSIGMGIFRGATKAAAAVYSAPAATGVAALAIAGYDLANGAYPGTGSNVYNNHSSNNAYMTATLAYNSTAPKYLTFTTNTQRIISNFTTSAGYTAYSIEALFHHTTNNWSWIFGLCTNPNLDGVNLIVNDNGQVGRLVMVNYSSLTYLVPNANQNLAPNNWYHAVVTVGGAGGNFIYVNNVASGTTSGFTPNIYAGQPRHFMFGDPSGQMGTLVGRMAMGRFYNFALTSTQVSTLYGEAKAGGNPYALP